MQQEAEGFGPAYVALHRSGELRRRVEQAYARLSACDVCPRSCGVNRRETVRGAVCRTGDKARVASYHAHFGEESPLVGIHGSGTIFFANCNLKCQYCQNYDVSQLGHGQEVEPESLAVMMLRLQEAGCHNVNLVSPSHVVPQILAALLLAAEAGLQVPLVYNTGGYDSLATLMLLDGVVDIYMPDMKYSDADTGRRYSLVSDYPTVNRCAVKEMHRQVGDLQLDDGGVATRGLLVRHLVLPNRLAGTAEVVTFLAEEISTETYLNVMAQYRPCYKAGDLSELNRRISDEEYRDAVGLACDAGLRRLDQRVKRWYRPLL
jgi:putative pyruvate formate lyase activating enzyme